jgi:integrase
MQERGLGPQVVRYTHAVLSSALKQGVKWDMLHKNPASAVDLPRMVRKEMKAMTPAEASRFLEAVKGTRQYALFNFALTTGMRPRRNISRLNGLTLISKEDWQRFGGRLSGSAKKAAGGPLLSLRLSGHAGRYLCPPQP